MKQWIVNIKIIGIIALSIILGMIFQGARERGTETPLPSIYDIQRMIGVAPDGLPGPITMEAWSKACANQQGIKWYEYMEKE